EALRVGVGIAGGGQIGHRVAVDPLRSQQRLPGAQVLRTRVRGGARGKGGEDGQKPERSHRGPSVEPRFFPPFPDRQAATEAKRSVLTRIPSAAGASTRRPLPGTGRRAPSSCPTGACW